MTQQKQIPLLQHIEAMRTGIRAIHSDVIASRIDSEESKDLFAKISDKTLTVYKAVAKDKTSNFGEYTPPAASQNALATRPSAAGALSIIRNDLTSLSDVFKIKGFKVVTSAGAANSISNSTKSVLTKAIADMTTLIDLFSAQ